MSLVAARTSPVGGRVVEIGLMLGLAVVALALRLPNLQLVPVFTDEVKDINRALLTARGQLLPLTDTMSYIGSLWDWLMAAALLVSGFSLSAPRALMLALGVLTVLVTYPLGRAWGGPAGGLLAAGLLATSAEHIAFNSHIAWSNCMTPLFSTLAVWALHEAVGGIGARRRTALLLSGLFWGLAVQTHPTALALLPGAAFFLAWKGPGLLRSRWPYLAAGLFALVNLNLIAYNLGSGFGSVIAGLDIASSHAYGRGEQLTAPAYAERVVRLLLGLLRRLGGAVDRRSNVEAVLVDPGLWPIGLLAVAGVARQWRRGNPLPGLLLGSVALILPLFNGRFEPPLVGRYLMPLLPVLYAGLGSLFAARLDRLHAPGRRRPGAPLARTCLGLAAVFLALHPLLYLQAYYTQEQRGGRTNAPIFETVEQIRFNRQAGETVIIDEALHERSIGAGSGRLDNIFQLALALDNVPYRPADPRDGELLDPDIRCRDRLMILATESQTDELVASLDLRGLDHGPGMGRVLQRPYDLYRLDRLPDAPVAC